MSLLGDPGVSGARGTRVSDGNMIPHQLIEQDMWATLHNCVDLLLKKSNFSFY
jgi:hypothetical protein